MLWIKHRKNKISWKFNIIFNTIIYKHGNLSSEFGDISQNVEQISRWIKNIEQIIEKYINSGCSKLDLWEFQKERTENNNTFIKETIWDCLPKWNGDMNLKIEKYYEVQSKENLKRPMSVPSYMLKNCPYWGKRRRC